MLSNIIPLAIAFSVARVAAAAELSLLTPAFTQCQESKIEWSGGDAKYAVFMVPYNDPCGDAVKEWPHTSKNIFHYNVSVPAGSKVQLLVEDSNGDEAWSGVIEVGKSDDDSCLDQKAVAVLKSAGALAVDKNAGSSSSAAGQQTGSIYAPPVGGTPGAKGPYPTSGAGSSDGVANAANGPDLTPQQSGSLPHAQAAGSIAGLAVLLFTLFQL